MPRTGSGTHGRKKGKKGANREKEEEWWQNGNEDAKEGNNDHLLCARCYTKMFAHANLADLKNLSPR